MKLLNALIPASFAVYPYGYLTNNCVNNLCVECEKTKMIGAVKYTVIDTADMVQTSETDITNALTDMAYFNGETPADCGATWQYNAWTKTFQFEIDLGKCGMVADTRQSAQSGATKDYLRFTQSLIFEESYPDKNAFFGKLGDFEFACNYLAEASTEEESYVVKPNEVTQKKVEAFTSWAGDFLLDFHTSSAFNSVISSQSLTQGDTAYFQVKIDETFGADFPAEFYVKECSVSDGTTSYSIVKDGCLSDLTSTVKYGTAFNDDKVGFSYRTFSLTSIESNQNLKIACDVRFCLSDDIGTSSCDYNPVSATCDTDYTKQTN